MMNLVEHGPAGVSGDFKVTLILDWVAVFES